MFHAPWRLPLGMLALVLIASPAAAKRRTGAPRPKPGVQSTKGKKDPGAEASKAFQEGQRLFEQADNLGAIEAFSRAYKLRPHHVVMCNIALCHERQGDMVAAARSYQRCLDDGAAKAPNAEAVRNSMRKVQARITWVEVKSERTGGTVFVDGKAKGAPPRRIPVSPGARVIEVRQEGARTASETLQTRGGEERQLTLTPVPRVVQRPVAPRPVQPPRAGLSSIWFWGAAGLTVALATVATILGVQTLGIRDDYEASPSRELLDRGKSRRLATNVLWGLTAAAAGSTAVLFFYTDFKGLHAEERSGAGAGVKVVFGLQGSF